MDDKIAKDTLIEIGIAMLILLALIILLLPILLLPILIPTLPVTWIAVVETLLLIAFMVGLAFYLHKSTRYRALALVVSFMGIALMFGAYYIKASDLIWDVNIFASGVTVFALGMTLITVFYHRPGNMIKQQLASDQVDTNSKTTDAKRPSEQTLTKESLFVVTAIAGVSLVAFLVATSRGTQKKRTKSH